MRLRAFIAGMIAPLAAGAPVAAQQPAGALGARRGTPIEPGEECPAGAVEIRPLLCQAPELPPPSIVDYRPHSTLVAPAHLVPKAKYPAIDFHGHPQGLIGSSAGLAGLGASFDGINGLL